MTSCVSGRSYRNRKNVRSPISDLRISTNNDNDSNFNFNFTPYCHLYTCACPRYESIAGPLIADLPWLPLSIPIAWMIPRSRVLRRHPNHLSDAADPHCPVPSVVAAN